MKKTCWVYLIIMAIATVSCQKEGEGVAPSSYFCLQKNGKNWKGEIWANVNQQKNMDISIMVYDHNMLREVLTIGNIPIQKGLHTLKTAINSTSYTTLQDDGDVVCDIYDLWVADSLNNYVEMADFDIGKKLFEGTFSGTYIRNRAICDESKPDTLRFREGTFHIKLK